MSPLFPAPRSATLGLALLLLAASARAEEPPGGKLVVDFAPPRSGSGWFVSALEEMVGRELSRFHHVQLLEKLEARRCPTHEASCLVAWYGLAGAQVLILGALRDDTLKYEVYDTSTGSKAFDGSISLAKVTTPTLQRHIGDIVRPIVQRGGLLDQQPAPPAEVSPAPAALAPAVVKPKPTRSPKKGARPVEPVRPPTPVAQPVAQPVAVAAAPESNLLPYVLVALMLFFAWPGLLLTLLWGRRELRAQGGPASWRVSALLIAALSILLVVTRVWDLGAALGKLPGAGLMAPTLGGMLWGAFVLLNLGWVFAPIEGLGDVGHDALSPLLRSWLAASWLRALLFCVGYAPVLLLTLEVCQAVGLEPRLTLALALPTCGLLADLWFLTLVDNLSFYLDRKLVLGPATSRNPWHTTIKRYFLGYIRRSGVDLDPKLLERTLFLPSPLLHVDSYGGGFARPRILVGGATRDLALGELPDETEAPERTVNPDELPYGILWPEPTGSDSPKQAKANERRRLELTQAPPRPRGPAPRLLGENATLLGWVLPQTSDEGVPLIANTSEEFDVVKSLLTEHYAAFEKNIDADEVDDTDPSQKDLLFGALIRELGAFPRGDGLVASVRHGLARAAPNASWVSRRVMRGVATLHRRFLSGPPAAVADAHAVFNAGLHHLIQYLYHLRGQDKLLTARANAPQLTRNSKEILDRLAIGSPTDEDRHALSATPRNRMLWLSQFFYAPTRLRRPARLRTIGLVVAALAGCGLLFSAVEEAIEYHPRYLERMRPPEATPDERPAER